MTTTNEERARLEGMRRHQDNSWTETLARSFTVYGIGAGIVILTVLALHWAGPTFSRSTGWTVATFGVICSLTGIACCLRRRWRWRWRPAVSTASGALAVGFAWFTAEMANFDTPASTHTTVTFFFAAFGFAITYAVIFRPLGAAIRQEEAEDTMRLIMREELRRANLQHESAD